MANAPRSSPSVANPLATIEQRWNRAVKVLHVGPKAPSLTLADVTTTSHASLNSAQVPYTVLVVADL